MSRREVIEQAIIDALKVIGPATARQIESHPGVHQACRQAKLKARHRLEAMMLTGMVMSDRAGQGAMFWVSAVSLVTLEQPDPAR